MSHPAATSQVMSQCSIVTSYAYPLAAAKEQAKISDNVFKAAPTQQSSSPTGAHEILTTAKSILEECCFKAASSSRLFDLNIRRDQLESLRLQDYVALFQKRCNASIFRGLPPGIERQSLQQLIVNVAQMWNAAEGPEPVASHDVKYHLHTSAHFADALGDKGAASKLRAMASSV